MVRRSEQEGKKSLNPALKIFNQRILKINGFKGCYPAETCDACHV
jgi:hypothetical protein